MNDLPETLDQLSARVDALEHRVHQLELGSAAIAQPPAPVVAAAAVSAASDLPSADLVSGAFLLLGKALLGIAGAYLLRALAEWNALPRLLIPAIAIAYAIGWLVAASRTQARERFAPSLFACTSALILGPMLWELTMRFQVLTAAASAAVLGLFAGAATALTWKKEDAPELAIVYGAAAVTALALSVVTHQMLAFLMLLLLMMAVCEFRFVRSGRQGVLMLVAAVSDCAAWILIVIYQAPASTRADYPVLGWAVLALPASLLFLITGANVVYRVAVLRRRITLFETAQSVIAFLLGMWTGLILVPGVTAHVVGAICLAFAGACHAAAYGLFRHPPDSRNFHVFAFWSASLLLAGVFLTLPTAGAVTCLSLAALASAALAVRICCNTLECHAIVYLSVAALACGLLQYSFRVFTGTMPQDVAWILFLVFACAVLIYASTPERQGERWQLQLMHLLPAMLAAGAVAAFMVHGTLSLMTRIVTPGTFHIAFIRTLILCALALALAFTGSRWHRIELRRIAFGALALIALKLVFEDLRHGHMGFIAGSIFLFAITLIGVPRLARVGQRLSSS